jgi:hypothetical protein
LQPCGSTTRFEVAGGRALITAAEDQARRLGCALVEFRAYDLLARPP